MNRILRYAALVVIFLWSYHTAYAEKNSLKFSNYSIKDGLSQSYITDVIQDRFGFLWVATQDGLNRFDGRRFLVYKNNPGDNQSLINNYVTTICESGNSIWVGTENGISIYSQKKKTFRQFKSTDGSQLNNINVIQKDNLGNIWIGTDKQGLFYYNAEKNKLVRVLGEDFETNSWNVTDIYSDNDGALWMATENRGLYRVELDTGVSIFKIKFNGNFSTQKVEGFGKDKIVFTSETGLKVYDIKNRVVKDFGNLGNVFENILVTDLFSNDGVLWIGTFGNGLFKYENNELSQYRSSKRYDYSLISDNVENIFEDRFNNIWVGTQKGLSKFDKLKQSFHNVNETESLEDGLTDSDVWSFYEDVKTGDIFVGTNKSLTQFDIQAYEFKHFSLNQSKEESSIITIEKLENNRFLLGTFDGLFEMKINADQSDVKQIFHKNLIEPEKNNERIYEIIEFNGEYLIGTRSGVVLTNRSLDSIRFFVKSGNATWQSEGGAKYIFKAQDGSVYIAPGIQGIYKVNDIVENGLEFVSIYEKVPESLKSRITSVSEDQKYFWLGTYGSGLIKVDKTNWEVLANYGEKDGLSNNVIYGTLIDNKGKIWMSTNRGISVFDPVQKTFSNYSESDGLQSDEFNAGAFLKTNNGTMFFGGINGFNYFHPNKIRKNDIPPKPVITELDLFGKLLNPNQENGILNKAIELTDEIHLKYNQNNLTFQFAALHYSNPEKNLFKIKMEGVDEEYLITNRDQVTYSGMPPGEYTLILYAANSDHIWSSPLKVKIVIEPPFWGTLWFRIIVIAFLGLSILLFYRYRINQIRDQKIKLELQVVERTREITNQNKKIQDQKRRVEKQKAKIEEQKSLIEKEKDRVENLLLNILPETTAHELRDKGKSTPRGYKRVTVMFTDFVGFSGKSEEMKPSDLIQKLDGYFSKFDEIIEKYHIEKIKTIGDAYMCAGGLPIRNKENPVETVLAGLEVQHYMNQLKEKSKKNNQPFWELRLGIHTGEVVAGVIGKKRFAYDIWGHTVNLASRMEMHGESGKVNVSERTFSLVEPFFLCTYRGKIKTKSRGYIDMYFIDRIKPELSKDKYGIVPNNKFWEILNLHVFSSINYLKAERHIMKLLEDRLPKGLHYHSIDHTKDVTKAAERLAIMEGVTDEGLFLLKSAATYHDAGFIERYEKNEPIGVRLANEILPKYGYTQEQIDVISGLIHATTVPHNPQTNLQEIICDADLDYLGRDDFHEIADNLRLELREHGKINSDRLWDEIQIKFLEQHRYFTKSAIKLRKKKKIKHIEEIKERLARDEYND